MPSLCTPPPLSSTPCLWPPLPLPDPLLHGLPLFTRKTKTFRSTAKSSLGGESVQCSSVSHVLVHAFKNKMYTHTHPIWSCSSGPSVKLQSALIGRPRQKHDCNPVRSNCVKSVVLCNSWALKCGYTSVQIACIFLVPTLILPHNCKDLQDKK